MLAVPFVDAVAASDTLLSRGCDCLELLFVVACTVCEHTGGVKAQGTRLLEYLS